jgi:hypothetical protein
MTYDTNSFNYVMRHHFVHVIDYESMDRKRRWVLRGSGLAAMAGLAGCSSITDSLENGPGSDGGGTDYSDNLRPDAAPTERVVRQYFDALDAGDVEGVNELLHNGGETPEFTEEDAAQSSEVSITVENVSTVERSGQGQQIAIVRAVITADSTSDDRTTTVAQGFELRIQDGYWRIYSDAEVEPVPDGEGGTGGGGGSIDVEFSREVEDRNFEWWNVVNNTGELAKVVTVSRVDRDGKNTPEMFYRVPAGEKRSFQVRLDSREPELENSGTWLESEYQPTEDTVETTATATGVDDFGQIVYSVPNPTGIGADDIREVTVTPTGDRVVIKAGTPDVGVEDGELVSSTGAPIWTDSYNADVSSVSESETFTFTAGPQPEIDISIDDLTIDDDFVRSPTVTFTAESATPVVNATVLVMAAGPSFLNPEYKRYRDSVRADADAGTLVTTNVGEARPGTSRTVTFDEYRSTGVDFPIGENDVIRVGVISGAELASTRYPIAYTEQPLQKFV